MTIKQASKIRIFFLGMYGIYKTFTLSAVTLFSSLIGMSSRKNDSRRFRHWAKKLVNAVNSTVENNLPADFKLEENRAYIIMSNHSSLMDIPLITLSFPGHIRMMAKKELSKVPFWGRAMKKAEFVFVDRNNRKQAAEDIQMAKKIMEDGIILWIAPEGTRSLDGKLLPFKGGAFNLALKMDAIIVPATINGAGQILPAKSTNLSLGVHVNVKFGKFIDTRLEENQNRKELTEKVYNIIQSNLI